MQARKMVEGLQVQSDPAAAAEQIKALYNTFCKSDCTMVEVPRCLPTSQSASFPRVLEMIVPQWVNSAMQHVLLWHL
jgi:hypothetical protein